MVIFLDVKNAVNSAPWRRILAKLREVEVEPYYRKLPLKPQDSGTIWYNTRKRDGRSESWNKEIRITSGVPQESIF